MMNNKKFEPWKEYPNIWKTESQFWTWLRGGLRLGLWNKSPIKHSFKNARVGKPPEGIVTRAKTGTYCALSGEWTGKSKLDVDHKVGNVPLKCVEDILGFVLHLIPSHEDLQLVSKEAHKIKSYAEKQGISFEEAKAEKLAIARIKELSVKEQQKELTAYGFGSNMINNATNRRRSYVAYYTEEAEKESSSQAHGRV